MRRASHGESGAGRAGGGSARPAGAPLVVGVFLIRPRETREPLTGESVRADAEPARDRRDHLALGRRDTIRVVCELAEHPARQHFLERAVEHPRREACVDVGAEGSLLLPAPDDPLQARKRLADLVQLVLDVRTAGDLTYEQPDEVWVVAPGAQDDLDDERELLGRRLTSLLRERDGREQPPPRLAEDRLEHCLLRPVVVVDESVGDTGLLRDVADRRCLVALPREDADRGVEDLPALVVASHQSVPSAAAALRRMYCCEAS